MHEKFKNILAVVLTAGIVVVLIFQIFTPKEATTQKKTETEKQAANTQTVFDQVRDVPIENKKTAAELEAREKVLLDELRLLNIEIVGQTSLINMDALQNKRDTLIAELADIDMQQEQQKQA